MHLNNFKIAFLTIFSILLISCSDSTKSKTGTTSRDNMSEIRLAMMQPPRTGLSPLSDDDSSYHVGVQQKLWLI